MPKWASRRRGHGAGGHAGSRFAGRAAAPAAVVAAAILGVVGIVGVAGAVGVGNVRVVVGALVGVGDEQADGRAGSQALEQARLNVHGVGLLAGRGEVGLAGPAPVEGGLNMSGIDGHARRAAVDNHADARPVRFAKRGDAKEGAEGIRHIIG